MTGKLQDLVAAANVRAGREKQRVFAKKAVVRQSAEQVIENLCARANDVLDAFYREKGQVEMRDAMKALHGAVALSGKRVRP